MVTSLMGLVPLEVLGSLKAESPKMMVVTSSKGVVSKIGKVNHWNLT